MVSVFDFFHIRLQKGSFVVGKNRKAVTGNVLSGNISGISFRRKSEPF